MGELSLDPWIDRPYGQHAHGHVLTDGSDIEVTLRRPALHNDSGVIYILSTGFSLGRAAMRTAAIEAALAGHYSVTFNYSNKEGVDALARNVEDFVRVADVMPEHLVRRVAGFSMGGTVATMGLSRLQTPVESANVIVPARFVDIPEQGKTMQVARHVVLEALELPGILRQPKQAAYLGITSLVNCVTRRNALPAEFRELIQEGTVHDLLRALTSGDNPPHLRFISLNGDMLIPAWAQKAAAANLPFNEVWEHPGGHTAFTRRPELMRRILNADAHLFVEKSLLRAA